jgi:hypothetical protein
MNLTNNDKYGFPFDWFVETYDELNKTNANELNDDYKIIIDNYYLQYALDYSKFINEISKLLNISHDDKIKYLKKEKCCLLCDEKYPFSFELFIFFKNYTDEKDITDICFDCSNLNLTCDNCNKPIEQTGPYEQTIFIHPANSNIFTHVIICEFCKQNNKELPLVSLSTNKIQIQIEFIDLEK